MTPGEGTGTDRLVTEIPEARRPERRSCGGGPGSGALGLAENVDVSVAGFTLRPEARRPVCDDVVLSFSSLALGWLVVSTAGFTLSPDASRLERRSEGAGEAF